MFKKILIANRGEIACRIMSTAHRLGIKTVAVYSDADAGALHVAMADEAVNIGPAAVGESYLKGDRVIKAAKATNAEAIHPGYGFLSENPDFVDAVEAAGLTFVGPSADAIRKMGLKDAAKELMEKANVPVVPGYHGNNQDPKFLARAADEIGYPVLIKARAGGGGKGMRIVDSAKEFATALESAQREGQASFGDPIVLIEKYITAPRHIEVQVFGDNHGNVIHLFERDCSLQRRHQKVIEEAPAPGMTDAMRVAMTNAAVKAAKAIDYSGAGTVEFIVDGSAPLSPDGFWFMEMNTRLQVEHPVTEAITGHDLVEWQLRVAAGEPLPETQKQQSIRGHAFEARLYAEDTANGFLPVTGHLAHVAFGDARIETGVRSGDDISPWYDPMIAKVITHAETRDAALQKMRNTLANTHIVGTVTNVAFLSGLCTHQGFSRGEVDTGLIERDLEQLMAPTDLPETAIALAAIQALDLDFTAQFAGWRLWGEASHNVDLIYGDQLITRRIVLHGGPSLSSTGNDSILRVDDIAGNGTQITARIAGKKISADVITHPMQDGSRSISVLLDGNTWVMISPDPLAQRAAAANNDHTMLSPMTGLVRVVEAKAGQKVKTGDRLIVVEAMKMEHSLVAPRDCKIAEVLCEKDQPVDSGAVLIRFELDKPA